MLIVEQEPGPDFFVHFDADNKNEVFFKEIRLVLVILHIRGTLSI